MATAGLTAGCDIPKYRAQSPGSWEGEETKPGLLQDKLLLQDNMCHNKVLQAPDLEP